MKDKLNQFMAGRYGTDALSKYMLGAAVAIMLLNLLLRIPLLNTLVVVIFVLIYVRMFSRDIQKRYAENQKFLALKSRFLGNVDKKKQNVEQMKTYHIYRCPNCSQKIRIPRGKGKIMITCPKCGHEFQKKS